MLRNTLVVSPHIRASHSLAKGVCPEYICTALLNHLDRMTVMTLLLREPALFIWRWFWRIHDVEHQASVYKVDIRIVFGPHHCDLGHRLMAELCLVLEQEVRKYRAIWRATGVEY